ncbi:MAG: ATP-binding protein, partial [Syntrophaceae bacterium]|nr:ATP-binding protein [Syntrophaceae bacterium]
MTAPQINRPYNPAHQNAAFLEKVFVGRDTLLSDIVSSIVSQKRKPTHQHWLLIGPRGIGKSHILALVRHRVKSDRILNAHWIPVWFPEEATGIITLRDFMEKILSLASSELKDAGLTDDAGMFADELKAAHDVSDDRKA